MFSHKLYNRLFSGGLNVCEFACKICIRKLIYLSSTEYTRELRCGKFIDCIVDAIESECTNDRMCVKLCLVYNHSLLNIFSTVLGT